MQRKLNKKYAVFVDNCILSSSIITTGVLKTHQFSWGGSNQIIDVLGYVKKPRRDEWTEVQQLALQALIREAKIKQNIQFYSYNELNFEAMGRSMGSHLFPGYLFEGINIIDVPPPIERSKFFQTDFGVYISRDLVIEFCKFLLATKESLFIQNAGNMLSHFEMNNITKLERFREICKGLDDGKLPDALHLWTAEVNGMDFFLTTDKRFINIITETKNIETPVKLVTPAVLIGELKIKRFLVESCGIGHH